MASPRLLRRDALKMFAGAAAAPLLAQSPSAGTPTKFQLACVTLPYANFPLERALEGIASAGYRHVAWGRVHTRRIEQAAAAGMPFVLTFGAVEAGQHEPWIRNLKTLGAIARGAGVTIVLSNSTAATPQPAPTAPALFPKSATTE